MTGFSAIMCKKPSLDIPPLKYIFFDLFNSVTGPVFNAYLRVADQTSGEKSFFPDSMLFS